MAKKSPAVKTPYEEKAEKYRPLTKEELKDIEQMAAQGMNHEQICHNLDTSQARFYALKTIQSEISEAIQRGRAAGIQKVSNALFNKAAYENDFNAQKFYLQSQAAQFNPSNNVNLTGSLNVSFNMDFGVSK